MIIYHWTNYHSINTITNPTKYHGLAIKYH